MKISPALEVDGVQAVELGMEQSIERLLLRRSVKLQGR